MKPTTGISKPKSSLGKRQNDCLGVLEELLKKLKTCQLKQLPTDAPLWPTDKDYRAILDSVHSLDPNPNRKKKKSAWGSSFALVDKKYSKLRLKERIKKFAEYAETKIHGKAPIPEVTRRLFSWLKTGEDEDLLQLPKTAFSIYNGNEKASGKNVEGLLLLCSPEFKQLCSAELNSSGDIPNKWRPLVEYAAALEIVRAHKNYLKKRGRWISDFGEFLGQLNASELKGIESKVRDFSTFVDFGEILKRRKRELARDRKRRERMTKKPSEA